MIGLPLTTVWVWPTRTPVVESATRLTSGSTRPGEVTLLVLAPSGLVYFCVVRADGTTRFCHDGSANSAETPPPAAPALLPGPVAGPRPPETGLASQRLPLFVSGSSRVPQFDRADVRPAQRRS